MKRKIVLGSIYAFIMLLGSINWIACSKKTTPLDTPAPAYGENRCIAEQGHRHLRHLHHLRRMLERAKDLRVHLREPHKENLASSQPSKKKSRVKKIYLQKKSLKTSRP